MCSFVTGVQTCALPVFLLGMAAHAASAYAEPVKGDVAAGTVSQGTAPPGVFSRLSDSPDPITSSAETDEIVVTAERYGEAKVAAESESDEAEIANHGADDIQDLFPRLSHFTDPTSAQPVTLINCNPAAFLQLCTASGRDIA